MSDGSDDLAVKAKEAANLFRANKYDEALVLLEALKKKKPDDPKVQHNIAIVEYCRSGCTDPNVLLTALNTVKGTCEKLASAAEEKLEQITPNTSTGNGTPQQNPLGSPATSPSSSSIGASSTGAGFNVTYLEEYDPSLATLNTAIILYHLKQHAQAAALLEPLFRNIEPLDEAAAMTICLLLLDIWLEARRPEQAAGVLTYLEKAFGYLLEKSGEEGGQTSTPAVGADSALDRVADGGTETLSALAGSGSEGTEGSEALAGLGTREKVGAGSVRVVSTEDKHFPVPAADFRLWMHLYKARLHLLTRNMKNAKREVKNALSGVGNALLPPTSTQGNVGPIIPSTTQLSLPDRHALFMKAQMEYSRANYRKAIKLLFGAGGSPTEPPSTRTRFLSNLGCIHHKLGKHHMAAVYFSQALTCASSAWSAAKDTNNRLPLSTFSSDERLPILYNTALQHLLCGDYALAVRCFHEAAKHYHNQPTLWLRLAECCVGAYLQAEQTAEGASAQCLHRTGFTTTSGAGGASGAPSTGSPGAAGGAGEGPVTVAAAAGGAAGAAVTGVDSQAQLAQVIGAPQWRRLLLPVAGAEPGSTTTSWSGLGAGAASGMVPEGSAAAVANAMRDMKVSAGEESKGEGASKAPLDILAGWNVKGGGAVQYAGLGAEARAAQGLLSLEYAAMCLRNAVVLLDRADSTSAARTSPSPASPAAFQSSTTNGVAGDESAVPAGDAAAAATAGTGTSSKAGGLKAGAGAGASGNTAPGGAEGGSKADGKEGAKAGGATMASIAAFEEESKREASLVRQAVLANTAHLWLLCDHPLGALHAAEALLKVDGCTRESSFLSHTYAAEALCLLDRPQEAVEHLTASIMEHSDEVNPPEGTGTTAETPAADGDKEDGATQVVPPSNACEVAALTGSAARAALYVNLAAVYATKDEYHQAQQCALQALSIAPTSTQALLSLVFVELSQGHTDVALSLLKQRRHSPSPSLVAPAQVAAVM